MSKQKEKERTKNMDQKVLTYNTSHYEKRIEELQFDLREREARLKGCRQKIIDLKKGNLVLQEAMVEKERLYGKLLNPNQEQDDEELKEERQLQNSNEK